MIYSAEGVRSLSPCSVLKTHILCYLLSIKSLSITEAGHAHRLPKRLAFQSQLFTSHRRRKNIVQHFSKINRVVKSSSFRGLAKVFALLLTKERLNHEQRLQLKQAGGPCSKVTLKGRSSNLSMKPIREFMVMVRSTAIIAGHV